MRATAVFARTQHLDVFDRNNPSMIACSHTPSLGSPPVTLFPTQTVKEIHRSLAQDPASRSHIVSLLLFRPITNRAGDHDRFCSEQNYARDILPIFASFCSLLLRLAAGVNCVMPGLTDPGRFCTVSYEQGQQTGI